MRKIYFSFLFFLCLLFCNTRGSAQVVISQVYGGGGNAGATYTNDFIEIFNKGTAAVSLAGWSVQYAASGGTSWQVTALSGTIQPGQYYLIQEAAGAGGTVSLPTPDATGSIAMSGTAGKVALVNSTVALTGACSSGLQDIVGFGAANCSETSPTATLSNTTAAIRKNDGCTDDGNNSTDFSIAAPTPRNTASALHSCAAPPASTVSVAAGTNAAEPATNGSFTITLSAAAPVGGLTINYTLSGTAVALTDYTDPQNGIITIPEGNTTGNIAIQVVNDAVVEATKTIIITLTSASNGYTIAANTSTINLTDDDVAPPTGGILLTNTYTQDFNTLANAGTGITWTDNVTINGWYSSRPTYNSGTGSSNAGALYSFGATSSADRSLGSVGSGSTGTVFYGARFKNNTGTTITSLKITYTGEQWRNGGNTSAQTVNFAYQTGTTLTSLTTGSWTNISNLNFTSPVNTATAAALDGNFSDNRILISYTISGLSIPANEELMIRFEDIDHGGADHGLGIDDFTIEANPADLAGPVISSLSPANGSIDASTNTAASITFNEAIQKNIGNILVKKLSDNSLVQTIDVNVAAVVVSGNTVSFPLNGLAVNTGYYIEVDNGAFEDIAGNDFAGITGNTSWTFTTGINFFTANFNTCTSALTDGFTQYSVTGSIVWGCTTFGRDPNLPPNSTAPSPNGVQINGFAGGTNVPNVDWLISPSFNLTSTTYPLLSFWSRTAFNGLPLQLKVSTNYVSGDPALATWTDVNGKFPGQTSNTWTLSSGINLEAFKQPNVHFAFVYTSSDDDGARWTIDDVSLVNSPTPPPPSLTTGTSDIQFTYVASGATADKTFTFTGNDLIADVTLTATGNFLLSRNGTAFSSSISYTQSEANNTPQTVYLRFAPGQAGQNYTGSVTISTGDISSVINLKGTSIDPATTLEVVNWNLEWFGSPEMDPSNDNQQEQNIKTIMQNIGADVFGLIEVVDEARLANIVSQMPGYSYVICNYGSHTNPFESNPGPLSLAQKAAFVYKTSMFSNITTTPLLSVGVNTAADLSNDQYNAWSSGRFPFMMSADVTLNCVTKNMKFVLVHAKANTSPTNVSYDRRKAGADALHTLLNEQYPNDNIIILGDFNDDLDQSITAGETTTSWDAFTTDATNFTALTLPLSLAGKKSTVSYNDVIDHVVVSNDLQPYYMESTASILNDVAGLVSNYGSTTTDHYPVFTRYRFATPLAPVIVSCPVVSPLCGNSNSTYTIPVLDATDDCGQVVYNYTISGATQRIGTTNNASGTFNIGTSFINWTVTDQEGNTSTCQTTVVVNENPTILIADAYALPSGTVANTVYIGYTPASSITLNSMASGGATPYDYAWSSGSNTANATVNPTTATNYTVLVTDANGCQATADKTINVKDVRGTKNSSKVLVCHKPESNNSTLEISAGDVASHLAHGDMLGACAPTPQYPPLKLTASPNPSSSKFNLNIKGGNPAKPVNLKVFNILGRVVEQKTNLLPGQTVSIGQDYRPGLYLVEISQGTDKELTILLKIR